ncbi:MAG: ion channel, partial [Arenibacterium sp.]
RHGVTPVRLARDGAISMLLNLMAFSILYRTFGISLTDSCIGPETTQASSALYFSMVTFSTLGYGDFRPCDVTRLWAASQAIIGNLHLAVLVAAAFLVASGKNAEIRKRQLTRLQTRRLSRRRQRSTR